MLKCNYHNNWKCNMDNENNETLTQRIENLKNQYKKRLLKLKIIFLVCAYSLLIATMVGISILLKQNGIENTNIITAIASTVAVLLLYSSTPICLKYSKRLKKLEKEITDLTSLDTPLESQKEFEEIISNNIPNNQNLPPIQNYTPTKQEKIATYFGVGIIFFAVILMFVLMSTEKYMHVAMFIGLLILMFWLYTYGMFLTISNKWLYSLYYPTISILIIALPPCIAAVITQSFAEWILILSTCLASVVSITLFTIFLYFSFTKPNKQKKKFIEENKQYITEINEEDGNISWYNQNGDMATIVRVSPFKCFATIYKKINNEFVEHKNQRFVEYQSALYFIYSSLMEMSATSNNILNN